VKIYKYKTSEQSCAHKRAKEEGEGGNEKEMNVYTCSSSKRARKVYILNMYIHICPFSSFFPFLFFFFLSPVQFVPMNIDLPLGPSCCLLPSVFKIWIKFLQKFTKATSIVGSPLPGHCRSLVGVIMFEKQNILLFSIENVFHLQ